MPGALTNFRAEDFAALRGGERKARKAKARKRAAAPAADPNEVPDGTSEEVLAWAGDDADRIARAIEKEEAAEKPRGATLLDPLRKAQEDAVPTGSVDDLTGWVGEDRERAQRALDAEKAKDKPRKTAVEALEALLADDGADDEEK